MKNRPEEMTKKAMKHEIEALFAVEDSDDERLQKVLDSMSDSELMHLRTHALVLQQEASQLFLDRKRGVRERPTRTA